MIAILLIFLALLQAAIVAQDAAEVAQISTVTVAPCQGKNCGIHVFRVQLTNRPEEKNSVVKVKPRRKYGGNVYVPSGGADNFELVDQILEKKKNLDTRVQERIKDSDFVLAPVVDDPDVPVAYGDQLPSNYYRFTTPQPPTTSVYIGEAVARDNRITMLIVTLLVLVGLLVGVLLTTTVYFICEYNKQPTFDRSKSVVYCRQPSVELITVDPMYDNRPRNHIPIPVRASPAHSRMSVASSQLRISRTPWAARTHVIRREQESLAESEM